MADLADLRRGRASSVIEKKNYQNKSVKVCVIGLGTVGYPTACYIENYSFLCTVTTTTDIKMKSNPLCVRVLCEEV